MTDEQTLTSGYRQTIKTSPNICSTWCIAEHSYTYKHASTRELAHDLEQSPPEREKERTTVRSSECFPLVGDLALDLRRWASSHASEKPSTESLTRVDHELLIYFSSVHSILAHTHTDFSEIQIVPIHFQARWMPRMQGLRLFRWELQLAFAVPRWPARLFEEKQIVEVFAKVGGTEEIDEKSNDVSRGGEVSEQQR